MPHSAAATSGYEVYVNPRYGFSIELPVDLFRQAVPENRDGQSFRSRDGGLHMTVSAIPDDEDDALEMALADASSHCLSGPPEYRVRRVDWFVVSCRAKEGILYRRTVRAGLARTAILTTVVATYPEAERFRWDPVVARASSSLRAAPPLLD